MHDAGSRRTIRDLSHAECLHYLRVQRAADPDGVMDAYGDYVIAVITSLPGENGC
jgi:hypothetical protein